MDSAYKYSADKIIDRMKPEKPKGTRDFSPEEMEKREHVKRTISRVFEGYNYKMIQIPTFENAELFQHSKNPRLRPR